MIDVAYISLHGYALIQEDYNHVFGGAEVQMHLLACEMAKDASYTVTMYNAGDSSFSKKTYKGITIVNCFNIQKKGRLYKILHCLQFLYRLFRSRHDVYIQRNAGFETGIIAFICKIKRKRFIYMVSHEIDCSKEYECTSGISGMFYSYGLRHASYIVVQHEEQQKLLREHYHLNSSIISTGYPIERINRIKKDYILWVGRVVPWKNIETCIEYAEQLPEIQFVVIASGDTTSAYYIQATKDIQKCKNIELISYVPFSKINAYFAQAKLFLNTSLYEGFPNTFVQAFKNGVPVLSAHVNPENMLEHNEVGFCSADTQTAIQFIQKAYSDESHYNAMVENCYTLAEKKHDIYNSCLELKTIIEKDQS